MSTMSEKARAAARSKAERLVATDPRARVDASGYRPDGAMDANIQTGMRPLVRRQYARGGVAGEASHPRADRKARASGGRALTADSLINRDVREANKDREGIKHDGGFARGGRLAGGPVSENTSTGTLPPTAVERKAGGQVHGAGCRCHSCGGRAGRKDGGAINDGTRPTGGRMARKSGGRAKKGTNVNIIITQPGGLAGGAAIPPRPLAVPPPGPVGMRQGVPAPAVPPQAAMPPPGMMPPGRASGGRAPSKPVPSDPDWYKAMSRELEGGEPQPNVGGRKGNPKPQLPKPRASGGRAEHKAVIPGEYPLKDGAGGGKGRLEKIKAYG